MKLVFIEAFILKLIVTTAAVKKDYSELCQDSEEDRSKRDIHDELLRYSPGEWSQCRVDRSCVIMKSGECGRCLADAYFDSKSRECKPCSASMTNSQPNVRKRCKDRINKKKEKSEFHSSARLASPTPPQNVEIFSPTTTPAPTTSSFHEETRSTVKRILESNKTDKNKKKSVETRTPVKRILESNKTDKNKKKSVEREKKEEESVAIFWAIFGSAIGATLLVIALLAIALLLRNKRKFCFQTKKGENSGESNQHMLA